MVKVKNANVGRGENVEEGGSSRGRIGKGKRVPSGKMGFEKNEEGMIVRGRQDESDEDDERNEEQERMNIDEEESEEEPKEESYRREMRKKKSPVRGPLPNDMLGSVTLDLDPVDRGRSTVGGLGPRRYCI
ncbi:hypothetical protein M9H77_09558 [Catharanthus roseus]|uniref:Uncharacterized protein n=1 Tax=Catharanthus roseus TaxID=4058 RepID=A0ACC0C0V8_CATRO|nr:hypothetical protein M9H77_09558 [Catharanthus roseus]